MRNSRGFVLLFFVGCSVLGVAATALAQDSSVTIQNGSSFTVNELYLSPTTTAVWGPDQLGEEVVPSGSAFMLTGIGCDLYDLKLVDEDGDECVLVGVGLCEEDATWDLTDAALVGCEMATAEEGAVEGEDDESGVEGEDEEEGE